MSESGASVASGAAPEHEEFITVNNTQELWNSLSKTQLDAIQPIAELVDNGIAAVLKCVDGGHIAGTIYIVFDFDKGEGSIEHYGGSTFPTKKDDLMRCFTYGNADIDEFKSSLNEHGCGMKTSLAILDPTNKAWAIYIKNGPAYYCVRAPYSMQMRLLRPGLWPGSQQEPKYGSYITFPINKDRFGYLYTSKTAKKADIDARIRAELSHMWMKQPHIANKDIKIFYNGEAIEPFNPANMPFTKDQGHELKKMSSGGTVDIKQYFLKSEINKHKDTNWFKYSQGAAGIYFFKNGRYIDAIRGDNSCGGLYEEIMGSKSHQTHIGCIVIVNLQGNQSQLPKTVTTKNKFLFGDPLFKEVCGIIRDAIVKPSATVTASEESLVKKYVDQLRKDNTKYKLKQDIDVELRFDYPNSKEKTVPYDAVIRDHGSGMMTLIEAKASASLAHDHITQLFTNWCVVCALNPGVRVLPKMLLNCRDDYVPTAQQVETISLLGAKYGFELEILNYDDSAVYPRGVGI